MVGMRAPFSLKCHQHRVYLSCRRGKRIVFDSFITILEHMHASKKKMFFHPRGFCILDEEKAEGTSSASQAVRNDNEYEEKEAFFRLQTIKGGAWLLK